MHTTSKFSIEGIDKIKELMANFSPSLREISLKGLNTLKILKTLNTANSELELKNPKIEKTTIIKSKMLEICLK